MNVAKPYAFFPSSVLIVSKIGHFAASSGSDDEILSKALYIRQLLNHPVVVAE
jgi:hypothetical protein